MAVTKPWWAELESRIFTIYKTKLNRTLISKFPNLNCTVSPMTKAASKFPTAYLHMADWIETGNDLENTETNAIIGTLQLDVIANTSLDDCKEVVYESINILKSLRFNIVGMPIYTANNNLYTGVIRFRRVVGNGESL